MFLAPPYFQQSAACNRFHLATAAASSLSRFLVSDYDSFAFFEVSFLSTYSCSSSSSRFFTYGNQQMITDNRNCTRAI